MMTDGMMDEMMWGVGLLWLLFVVLVLLAGAALVKYLFFNKPNDTPGR